MAALVATLALLLWSIFGLIQGAGLEFVANGREPAGWGSYVGLTYIVPFFAAVAGYWSRRLAAVAGVLLAACATWAAALAWRTGAFGAGGPALGADLAAVALRPALGAVVLLGIARAEAADAGGGPAWLARYFPE